jgi:hypothetical protein
MKNQLRAVWINQFTFYIILKIGNFQIRIFLISFRSGNVQKSQNHKPMARVCLSKFKLGPLMMIIFFTEKDILKMRIEIQDKK